MNSNGSVLMVAMLVLTLVSGLAVASLTLSSTIDQPLTRRVEQTEAFYLAQSGLELVVGSILTPAPDWSLLPSALVPWYDHGSGRFRVSASSLSADRAVLETTGEGAARSLTLSVIVERLPEGEIQVTGWRDPRVPGWPE